MKTFSRKKAMAALILAAATVGLPTTSYADQAKSSYGFDDCRVSDREGQILGGLIGAVAGGVAGSQIAGRGDRTEGTAIGAALGAAAGVAIADKDCGRDRFRTRNNYTSTRSNYSYNNTGYYGANTYRTGQSTYGRGYYPRGRSVGNPHINNNWGFTRGAHTCNRYETRIDHLKWEIKELKRERDYLKKKKRHVRYDRDLDRRIYRVEQEIDRLKYELKRAKDRKYNDYRNSGYRSYYKTKY